MSNVAAQWWEYHYFSAVCGPDGIARDTLVDVGFFNHDTSLGIICRKQYLGSILYAANIVITVCTAGEALLNIRSLGLLAVLW